MKEGLIDALWRDVEKIRTDRPLVHNITNYVVMEFTANALLALGASPVMAHAREEAADMAALAGAVVLNIGTLSPSWVEAMHLARQTALACGIPVVLDPVGCGATAYRTETARALLSAAPLAVIRGNASEMAALHGVAAAATRGVDSAMAVTDAEQAAINLAATRARVAVISGPTDLIAGPGGVRRVENGHAMMARVTGMGCSASALIGAFCAVNTDFEAAALHAMVVMGLCGEIAAEQSSGPGTFKVAFLDALYALTKEEVRTRIKVDVA